MASEDIVIRHDANTVVATLLLRRVTGSPAEETMWQSLNEAVGPSPQGTVVLDCRHVDYFYSEALGRLAGVVGRCRRHGARFVVRHLCPSLVQVFQLMRLDSILEIESESAGPDASRP